MGRIEVESSSREYDVSITISELEETGVAGPQSLGPNDPIETSFELERGTDHSIRIEFDPALRAVEVTDSAAERGWTHESDTIRGEIRYSSENQTCTVSVDDAGVATIEYDSVGVP